MYEDVTYVECNMIAGLSDQERSSEEERVVLPNAFMEAMSSPRANKLKTATSTIRSTSSHRRYRFPGGVNTIGSRLGSISRRISPTRPVP